MHSTSLAKSARWRVAPNATFVDRCGKLPRLLEPSGDFRGKRLRRAAIGGQSGLRCCYGLSELMMDLERPAGGTAKAVPQVLVVDDDDDDRSAMRDVLEDEGFVVFEARDGQKALDLMTSAVNPSLVILDLAMPVMSGGELVEVMKRYHRLSQVPVLVVSG